MTLHAQERARERFGRDLDLVEVLNRINTGDRVQWEGQASYLRMTTRWRMVIHGLDIIAVCRHGPDGVAYRVVTVMPPKEVAEQIMGPLALALVEAGIADAADR